MKTYFASLVLAVALLAPGRAVFGADSPAADAAAKPASSAQKELTALITKVQTKLRDGKKTEPELADEMKEFDTLLAKHKGEQTDDVAQIPFMKAMLYLQIFDDTDKGTALLKQLQKDFPNTKQAKQVDTTLANLAKQEEAKKIQRSLAVGAKFPDFTEKDIDGKPMSLANYKGKVVLVDFWATWCGPCIAELPNVLEAYQKHHSKGFEIVGISLDQSEQKLRDFIKTKNMPWQQFFDGKGWANKLAATYGVNSIPATYLLDGEGKIIGKDLRGDDLEQAVATALAKK
ncbi:MAG TPA: TlpA disulfide reductase family protein [Candidatus Limnocylindria bacterium]|nr:TlpA disulfide reductase family protein [Candidatus Limnocylindria bacterium]